MKKAPQTSHACAPWNINQLQRGATYRATTRRGTTNGRFLGMETPYGDRSILLWSRAGTASISLSDITSICPTAA
jgi:hypothetical protein